MTHFTGYTGCFIPAGRFQIAVTPEEIEIFQIGLFYLKVGELTVFLICDTKYFGLECALYHTPKKQASLSFGPISKRFNSRRNQHFSNRSFLFVSKGVSGFIDVHIISIRLFNHVLEI